MDDHEFLKYEPTPGEKHLGIATVRLYRKVIIRYKIVPNKDGTGFFPVSASFKMGGDGPDARYVPAVMLDSNYEKEELEALIKAAVYASTMGKTERPMSISQTVNGTSLRSVPVEPQEDLPF